MSAPSVTCSRCKVQVPVSALDMPNRCNDPKCPLNEFPALRRRRAAPPPATWPVLVFAMAGALLCAWGGISMALNGG